MRRRHRISGVIYWRVTGSAGQAEYQPLPGPVPGSLNNPLVIACNVRPLNADEVQLWGDRGSDTRTVFADAWPFDIHSILTFEGATWNQVEPAKNFDYGAATRHHEVVIRKR